MHRSVLLRHVRPPLTVNCRLFSSKITAPSSDGIWQTDDAVVFEEAYHNIQRNPENHPGKPLDGWDKVIRREASVRLSRGLAAARQLAADGKKDAWTVSDPTTGDALRWLFPMQWIVPVGVNSNPNRVSHKSLVSQPYTGTTHKPSVTESSGLRFVFLVVLLLFELLLFVSFLLFSHL
jgi:hypothetical protein